MKKTKRPIVIALIFAALLISSAWLFKGNPIGDWVDSAIYITGLYCLFQYFKIAEIKCVKAPPKG
jgi:hypothetical protein